MMTERRTVMNMMRRSRGRSAMTMVEMAVSVATISIVTVTVGYLTVASAKVNKEGINMLRSEARVRNGLDMVRRQALVAKVSSVKIENNGRVLEFHDPWAKRDPRFQFSGGTLSFHPDTDAPAAYEISGLNDVVFAFGENKRSLKFTITATAIDGNNVTRDLTLEDEIVLRNRPQARDSY
jgi:competence protein ComGC